MKAARILLAAGASGSGKNADHMWTFCRSLMNRGLEN